MCNVIRVKGYILVCYTIFLDNGIWPLLNLDLKKPRPSLWPFLVEAGSVFHPYSSLSASVFGLPSLSVFLTKTISWTPENKQYLAMYYSVFCRKKQIQRRDLFLIFQFSQKSSWTIVKHVKLSCGSCVNPTWSLRRGMLLCRNTLRVCVLRWKNWRWMLYKSGAATQCCNSI